MSGNPHFGFRRYAALPQTWTLADITGRCAKCHKRLSYEVYREHNLWLCHRHYRQMRCRLDPLWGKELPE